MKRLFLLMALAWSIPAFADDAPRVYIPLRVLEVHDGDTVRADLKFPWGLSLDDQTIRCQGYDAWEVTRARRTVDITDKELERGAKARDALKALIDGAEGVYLSPGERRDPYGRVSGFLFVFDEGKLIDVSKWMRQRGYQRSDPDQKPTP